MGLGVGLGAGFGVGFGVGLAFGSSSSSSLLPPPPPLHDLDTQLAFSASCTIFFRVLEHIPVPPLLPMKSLQVVCDMP